MKKIIIAFSVLLVIGTACSTKKRTNLENPSLSAKPAMTDLPSILLTKLDGSKFSAKSLQGHPVILVLFQASCDHCQREAKQIKAHIESFRNYQIYFISADSPQEASKFAIDYGLGGELNVTFALTDVPSVLNTFGPVSTPSVYIYDAGGKLITKFNGETDISLILKRL